MILRPEPGATATAERARRLGLDAVTAPMFTIRPLAWIPPEPSSTDALLLTSANAARCAGGDFARFAHLRCYALGEATAEAAREAGLRDVRTGPSDGAAVVKMAVADGVRRLLHLCGREHVPLEHTDMLVARIPVYASDAIGALPKAAADACARGAVALIHSARAAAYFAALLDAAGVARAAVSIAAISEAAAAPAGAGWKRVEAAAAPRDEALLELAAKLCQTGGRETGKAYE